MKRLKRLPWWLAGIYLCWSLFVYFGSLGGNGHCWWPIMLYPVIWPWGVLYDSGIQPLLDGWLAPEPHAAPSWVWMFMDGLAGGFYIIWGTVWMWIVGRGFTAILMRLAKRKGTLPNQALHATSEPAPGAASSAHEG
jgi:hypothetical protein